MLKSTRAAALSGLLVATTAFALDEYLPVPVRVMEIDAGFQRSAIIGVYDQSWEFVDQEREINPAAIPLQGKFGLLDRMEGSIAVDYFVEDEIGNAGFNRPVLALKYAEPQFGVGGFLAVTLPVGFEDIVTEEPYATLTFGALYGKALPFISLLANASYSFNTEDIGNSKQDEVRLFVKPEYAVPIPWLVKRKQYLGVNVAAQYSYFFNQQVAGESLDDGTHLLTVSPGIYYVFNGIVALDTRADFTLAGEGQPPGLGLDQPAHMGLRSVLRFTLNEDLYNSL